MRNKKTNFTEALGHQASDKRLDILRRIGEKGSISEAARSAGVSYKAAWQALETLSNLAGTPLVEKAVGGAGGGGARLTAAGEQLLRASEQMQAARKALMDNLESDESTQAPNLAALNLRTSMRNQLPCTIKALKKQGASIRVELALADGTSLYSRITRESAELLELKQGMSALALWKATAANVARHAEPRAGYNLLPGTVSRASARDEEIALQLAGGLQVVGFAGASHGLKAGQPALVSLEESAIVIAIAV
jgi:molybdate transport system regulatory protein